MIQLNFSLVKLTHAQTPSGVKWMRYFINSITMIVYATLRDYFKMYSMLSFC